MDNIGALDVVEKGLEAPAHAEFEDGAAQDVLDVGQGIGDLDDIVVLDGIGQLLDLLLEKRDTELAPIGGGDGRRGQNWGSEEAVEGRDGGEGAGIDEHCGLSYAIATCTTYSHLGWQVGTRRCNGMMMAVV